MTIIKVSVRGTAAALLATTALAFPALAQVQGTAPIYETLDGNGVDLTTGKQNVSLTAGSVGNGEGGLTLVESFRGNNTNNLQVYFERSESGTQVTFSLRFGDRTETFTGAKTATSFPSAQGTGATLTKVSAEEYVLVDEAGATTTYRWPAGTTYQGGSAGYCAIGNEALCRLLAETRQAPSGLTHIYTWRTGENCTPRTLTNGEIVYNCAQFDRLTTIASSSGYKVTFNYLNNVNPSSGLPNSNWYKRTGATFNDGATVVGSSSLAYPSSTVTELTEMGGRTWRITKDANLVITGIRRPGSAADNLTMTSDASARAIQVVADGVTTGYAYVDSGSTRTATVTNALGNQRVVTSDMTIGRPTSFRDELNRTISILYDASGRPTRVTRPEGNYAQLTYDARGNVTQSSSVAKAGSGLADIVTSAAFDATCVNIVKCNKPNTTTDELGNVTDYTYDLVHGGPLTVTQPAPTTGAVRPQTRYSYGPVTSSTGQVVTMLTDLSACQTLASCTGTADETKSAIGYNGNLLPTSLSRGDGTGTLAAATAMTYDNVGNLLTVDGPLPGTTDTSRTRYDAARQMVGTISPDPDGAGLLKHRAVRITYRPDGQVSRQELGTVNSQSDPDWPLFDPLETVDINFDANNRGVTHTLSGGGTAFALTQMSYDALGRPDCSATRMNPAIYGALPTSACSLGTQGSFGPDRIGKVIYDAAGQVTQNQLAVGTADAATERTLTYSGNGRLATLKDAENNLTTYDYDGHDRLAKTLFPLPAQGANASSSTDYEQLTYDAASNVTNRRQRDAQAIAFTFDNLDRVGLKDLPGSEPDVTYAYDNLGRLLSASQTGNALSFTYDALSRNLTQTGPQGTVASQWDIAGRRTNLTYPGSGLYVDYDYLVTGEMTKLRENGATSGVGVLATLAYDDLGRRTGLTFGNGVVQSLGYDAVSRLATLTNDLAGTTNDLSQTFAYNPASQIASTTRTGDAYAWTGHFNENKIGVANGLNQLTNVGTNTLTHDARGNVAAFGTKAFDYSSENLLLTGPAASLSYDPVMRLQQVMSGPSATELTYDGLDRIAEYSGANALQRRYVHGPADDEPIVWYEGSGTTDRRFLSSDERGSIISLTDSTGALIGINRYDEYGQPQSSNLGAFGYTGQVWLPQIGVWYYKARAYDSELGRFLQTDPIGVAGGMNPYTYVGGDPVNKVDPLGLFERGGSLAGWTTTTRFEVYHYRLSSIPRTWGEEFVNLEFLGTSLRHSSLITVASLGLSSSFGSGNVGGIERGTPQNSKPTCDTVLPDGRTIGEVVRQQVSTIQRAAGPYDIGGLGEFGAFAATVNSNGPIDFKLNFNGSKGYSAVFLGEAGNFAYGAIASATVGRFVGNVGAGVYGVGTSVFGRRQFSDLRGPFGMDSSAARNIPRGYATAGCTK